VLFEEDRLLHCGNGFVQEGLVVLTPDWVASIQDWKLGDVVLSLLWIVISIGHFNLLNVIITGSERNFPVILVQIWMVLHIHGARSWSWVSILNTTWRLVVFVTLDLESNLEGSPHLGSSLFDAFNNLICHIK